MRALDSFVGGLRLASRKDETARIPIRAAPVPERLFLPLSQNVGVASEPIVVAGQEVLKGQLLARPAGYVSAPIHAPTSGVIRGIVDRTVVHPGGLQLPCIELEPDGRQQWTERARLDDFENAEPAVIQELILRSGIIGLGGAGFPTHVKVREGIGHEVQTLIINGAECEPYITCDGRLIQERADEVVNGARIIAHAVQAQHCVVAVEDDMPAARDALLPHCEAAGLELVSVPAIYPAGGEKQLIKVVTGQEVPSGGLPIHISIVVQNVATAAAVHRAIMCGEPMVSRVVTVAGSVIQPGNVDVLLGTPLITLLDLAGLVSAEASQVLCGGPMMGIRVSDLHAPITKVTNCLLVQPEQAYGPERACIRCGDCIEVCPIRLQPQALYEYAKCSDYDAAQDHYLFDCIECGCCAYVCPSNIPLVHYYRYAKSAIDRLDVEHASAEAARERFLQRNQRLAREPADPRDAIVDIPATAQAVQADIKAAVARTRSKRQPDDGH